jgi:hypothetical protein
MPTAALSPCAWACPAQTSLTKRTHLRTALMGHANSCQSLCCSPRLLPLPSPLLPPLSFLMNTIKVVIYGLYSQQSVSSIQWGAEEDTARRGS